MRHFLLKFRPIALRLLGQRRYLELRQFVLSRITSLEPVHDRAAEKAGNHSQVLSSNISFSVIVPVYNTPEKFLRGCLHSVLEQTYPNWELIIVDDCSSERQVRNIIEEIAKRDSRVKAVFRSTNGNISQATNSGLEIVTGQYFTVLDHDDLLHPAALYWMAETVLRHPEAEYLYSDEDKTDGRGKRFYAPFLKPGWSPELTLQCMYSCHMSVYRTEYAKQIGGFRSEMDGAQDFDFMLRFVSKFDEIHHVDKVLYHWREWEQSTAKSLDAKPEAYDRQRIAIKEHLSRSNENYSIEDHQIAGHHKVTFFPKSNDRISIIIPTANKTAEIGGCLERHVDGVVNSILTQSTYENYEVILVHDNNFADDQLAFFEGNSKIKMVEYLHSGSFNYSEKVNLGAANASGANLVLMNDDTRVITKDWLERMLGMAQRDGVGAVGVKLLFPNHTIQHSGVWLRGNVPGHIDYGEARDTIGYDFCGQSNRNCIAVTAACQMTPRNLFEDLGGYDPEFFLNYNDVDYCLRLHGKGYRSVCLNDVELYHHEGASRTGGQDVSSGEIELFLHRWKDQVPRDPYLPVNLA